MAVFVALQTKVLVTNMRRVINSANTFSPETCGQLDSEPENINLVECAPNGFIGAYDWDPNDMATLLEKNSKGLPLGFFGGGDPSTLARRRLLATSINPGSNYTGILNPVTCVKYGEIIFFSVSNEHYPIYDK